MINKLLGTFEKWNDWFALIKDNEFHLVYLTLIKMAHRAI